MFYIKRKPKVTQYRKYKNFYDDPFLREWKSLRSNFSQISFEFKTTMNSILQTNTPVKKFKGHSPTMKCTEIMKKLHLRNKLMDSKTNKQRYHCVNQIRKEKKKTVSGILTLHKKWIFPLRIYAVSCGFGQIYWRNPSWKTSPLCSVKYTAEDL